MKVRLLNDAGYEGLANVQFPVEVELQREGYGLYYVAWDVISALPGWFYHTDDAHEGGSYCFYKKEVEVVVNPKIRVHSPSGYSSLMNLDFPMVLEAYRIGEDGAAFVKASVLRAWGVETDDGDFVFLEEEYTLVEEKKSLRDLFGENGHEAAERIGDAAAKDLTEQVFGADRKATLISLVKDYGGAINDGCYESECGSIQAMLACHEEEKRLLKEIIKMINEGV